MRYNIGINLSLVELPAPTFVEEDGTEKYPQANSVNTGMIMANLRIADRTKTANE